MTESSPRRHEGTKKVPLGYSSGRLSSYKLFLARLWGESCRLWQLTEKYNIALLRTPEGGLEFGPFV